MAALTKRLTDEPDRALPRARALVELRPEDEQARAALIGLLRAAGREGEADRHHSEGLRIAKELGLAPPAALQVVTKEAPPPGQSAGAGDLNQEIRFCTAPDGVSLAFATVGQGPPLVKAANWLNHLE